MGNGVCRKKKHFACFVALFTAQLLLELGRAAIGLWKTLGGQDMGWKTIWVATAFAIGALLDSLGMGREMRARKDRLAHIRGGPSRLQPLDTPRKQFK